MQRRRRRVGRLGLAAVVGALAAGMPAAAQQQPQQQPQPQTPPPQIPTFGDATRAQPRAPGAQSAPEQWAALAFTAAGQHWIVSRQATREATEQTVRQRCEQARAGECKISVASARQCIGLAVWRGAHSGRTFTVAVTRGGETTPEAQRNALRDCRTQPNVRSDCVFRAAICGDGR